MPSNHHVIEVWGDFACFSRPELRVERYSYPCPTPSAARGVFDAIYLKPPEFRWQITRIELLAPPAYIALRRNEVSEKLSIANAKKWMKGSAEPSPLFADDSSVRQQRQTMALRDPCYRIYGRIVPWPGFEKQIASFNAQFVRRASKGKCFQQPYLGCREFVGFYRLVEDLPAEQKAKPPANVDLDLGFMVYDVFDLGSPSSSDASPYISVFKAVIQSGVLEIPDYDDPAVLKPERRAG